MEWKQLTNEKQLEDIKAESTTRPQVIFKHSTRCGTSAMVKSRFDRTDNPEDIDIYLLDLIAYRNISNKIETDFMVRHESPQVLIIKNGECVYNESHYGIRPEEVVEESQKTRS